MQTAYLEVVIPPDIIYEETSGDTMTPEGGNLKLRCRARGYPPPKIVWKREDGADIVVRNDSTGTKTRSEYTGIAHSWGKTGYLLCWGTAVSRLYRRRVERQ